MLTGVRIALAVACAVSAAALSAAADKPRVTMEVVTRKGLAPTAAQQWYQTLSGLGVDSLRIHADTGGAETGVTNTGSAAAPAYKVVGIVSADNNLYVPGGVFGPRDVGKLRKWLDELRDEGVEGVTQSRSAFGLLPRQLQQIHDELKRPLGFSTKGMSAAAAVGQISKGLRTPVVLEAGASRALSAVTLEDELKELSRGTALAAIARPAGLVLRPARTGAGLEYRIERPQEGEEVWPIGWPPEKRHSETLPTLFEMLNVEIKQISVSEALAAIEGRLEVPFVFDRNAMALYRVDPATAPADVPAKRMSYSMVLRRVLSQAKLRYELRIDDAQKPFLWITTVKRAP